MADKTAAKSGRTIYERALDFIHDGDVVGLGSGRASTAFIKLLGERVKAGLRVTGVPTSNDSEKLARELGIPLVPIGDEPLTLTVDGADEVDPHLNLIKGWGRALIREKIVAAASRKLVILAGKDKQVPVLGTRDKLPVEIVPLALPLATRKLKELGLRPVPWAKDGKLLLTDNGNYILDCGLSPVQDAAQLEAKLEAIPGVVGTGLFLGMADVVLIGDQDNEFEFLNELLKKG
jgi:ribose 5-phosphate isomerase A